jgi:hypothetical protein
MTVVRRLAVSVACKCVRCGISYGADCSCLQMLQRLRNRKDRTYNTYKVVIVRKMFRPKAHTSLETGLIGVGACWFFSWV